MEGISSEDGNNGKKSVAGYYTTAHGAVKAGLFGCILISPGEISSLLI